MDDVPLRDVREVLVVEMLGGFGDLLLVLPAVHALARAYPSAAVRVVTLAPGDALLAHDPAVASVTRGDRDDAAGSVEAHLDRWPADLAVSTTMHSGVDRVLTGRVPHAVTNLWRSPPPDELVDRRFLRLLAAEGVIRRGDADLPLRVVLTPQETAAAQRLLPAGLERPLAVLPDAGMPVKRWPQERWRLLAARSGRPVVTVAHAGRLLPGAHVLPDLPLRMLAAVLHVVGARGGSAVGGDTGPLRLATAVGCPAVALHGPTLASRYGLSASASVSMQGLAGCLVRRPTAITEQECWWSARCPLPDSGGAPACMADLSVDQVLGAIERVGLRHDRDPERQRAGPTGRAVGDRSHG